jgi:hypothetical protein
LKKSQGLYEDSFGRGGKKNQKNFTSSTWSIVCQPIGKGGLAIHNPSLMNIALGENLVWHLITGPLDWWKQVILAKYIISPQIRI